MIIFDTDIFSIAQNPKNPEARVVHSHVIMLPPDVQVGTTIISYDEQTRGWFKYFSAARTRSEQVNAYARLFKHLADWQNANVFPFDENAAMVLDNLIKMKLRIGTNDLKIAAIVLSLNGTLITRNVSHFKKIPDLRIEDCTKP